MTHAGVNFQDVLLATGTFPGAAASAGMGKDCAGVVDALGPGTTGLAVGDEVVALAPSTMATHVVTSAELVARRPERLTAAEAATAATEIGFPVVAKLCGDSIAHKTERGLVRLGLPDAAAVESAAAELLGAATPADGEVGVLGREGDGRAGFEAEGGPLWGCCGGVVARGGGAAAAALLGVRIGGHGRAGALPPVEDAEVALAACLLPRGFGVLEREAGLAPPV